jgi:hypothetical protein
MISRRLKWAVSAQLMTTAVLVSPGMAHWNPEDCPETNPPPSSLRVCDEDCEFIHWGGGDYTVVVDAYICSLMGEPYWATAFNDDADEETKNDVCDLVMEECHDWRDGAS